MVRRYLPISKKSDAVAEAIDSGNMNGTAQKHDFQPNQIREWRKKEHKLIEKKVEMVRFLQFTLTQAY